MNCLIRRACIRVLCVGAVALGTRASAVEECVRPDVRRVVVSAFAASHDGYSCDEVLLDDQLNEAFLRTCHDEMPELDATVANATLLTLRKQAKLKVPTTKRRSVPDGEYLHAAEIGARWMTDKHGLNMDQVLCDPERRADFDRVAGEVAPGVSPYLLRKAALRLRKSRRLRPELVLRVAEWGKQVVSWPAMSVVADPNRIPSLPGVYLLRDRTGYLYVGESSDLRKRVSGHLDHSDRSSLARYFDRHGIGKGVTVELHVFDADSPARRAEIRRAYESELISSRKPRFNVRP